jgi:hypothetical protein
MAVSKTSENLIGKGKPGPGRPKGLPNKTTQALKDMILTALDGAHPEGGVGYLKQQANNNPTAFLSLVGKVLPMTVAGDPDNPVLNVTRIELVAPALPAPPAEVQLIEYGESTH